MVYRAKKKIESGVKVKLDLRKVGTRYMLMRIKLGNKILILNFAMLTLIVDLKVSGLMSTSTTNYFLTWMNYRNL